MSQELFDGFISLYTNLLAWALPITIVIHLANFIVNTLLRVMLGGDLDLRV